MNSIFKKISKLAATEIAAKRIKKQENNIQIFFLTNKKQIKSHEKTKLYHT